MAYLPPRWLKQRYGIISLSDESQEEQKADFSFSSK